MTDTAVIVQGAELPSITRTWLDADGDPVDLSTSTLTLRMQHAADTPIEKTTGVTGDAQGVVTIAWAVDELASVPTGRYAAQVWARDASNRDRVMPLTIQIVAQVPTP